MSSPNASGIAFSLIRGGLLYRLQQRLGLIPADGLGIARRAALYAAIAWLPIAISAIAAGRAIGGGISEPLLAHYGIHTRCLIAIPLFVVAQGTADRVVQQLLRYFVSSGIIDPAGEPAFRDALRACERWRDSAWGALAILGAAGLAVAGEFSGFERDELAWTTDAARTHASLGFAGNYYLFVTRPLFLGLGAAWIWRIGLLFGLMRRISRLELRLAAGHPDRAAGVGFLDRLPVVLVPVVFGLSAVLASRFAHGIVYHGEHVAALQPIMIAWAAFAIALFLLPVSPLVLRLARLRKQALLDYGALVGRQARLFEARWIEARGDDAALLAAPEISATADALGVYGSVTALRPLPVTLRDLVPYSAAILLPFLPVVALEIPVKDAILKILAALA